jgi:hypothetical protein
MDAITLHALGDGFSLSSVFSASNLASTIVEFRRQRGNEIKGTPIYLKLRKEMQSTWWWKKNIQYKNKSSKNNAIRFLFIFLLSEQPKDQLKISTNTQNVPYVYIYTYWYTQSENGEHK